MSLLQQPTRRRGRHRPPARTVLGLRLTPLLTAVALATGGGTAIAVRFPAGADAVSQGPSPSNAAPSAAFARSAHRASRGSERTVLTLETAERRAEQARQWSAAAARRAAAQAQALRWGPPMSVLTFTSAFKMRWGKLHAGIDLATPVGTPVLAMSTGTVTFAGAKDGYGSCVDIRMGDGTLVRYGHLSKVQTAVGAKVVKGTVVALSGNTGHSTGPHLHLEVHARGGDTRDDAVDPVPHLAQRGLVIPGATPAPPGTPAIGADAH